MTNIIKNKFRKVGFTLILQQVLEHKHTEVKPFPTRRSFNVKQYIQIYIIQTNMFHIKLINMMYPGFYILYWVLWGKISHICLFCYRKTTNQSHWFDWWMVAVSHVVKALCRLFLVFRVIISTFTVLYNTLCLFY